MRKFLKAFFSSSSRHHLVIRKEVPMNLKLLPLTQSYVVPAYATDGSGCLDLYISQSYTSSDWTPLLVDGNIVAYGLEVPLGYAVECPKDYTFDILSRSGHGRKHHCSLANSIGVVDSDYRNEVIVLLQSLVPFPIDTAKGPVAVAQARLTYCPQTHIQIVDTLSETSRTGGFGSTDIK